MFAPRCNGCKNPIKMNFITALGTHWHPECFVCQSDEYFSRRCPMHVTYFDEDDYYY
uniref:Paxillin 1 n=1 Tax=Ascaris suum TaxID=6253 RepID=F1LFC4_ASCSU